MLRWETDWKGWNIYNEQQQVRQISQERQKATDKDIQGQTDKRKKWWSGKSMSLSLHICLYLSTDKLYRYFTTNEITIMLNWRNLLYDNLPWSASSHGNIVLFKQLKNFKRDVCIPCDKNSVIAAPDRYMPYERDLRRLLCQFTLCIIVKVWLTQMLQIHIKIRWFLYLVLHYVNVNRRYLFQQEKQRNMLFCPVCLQNCS